MSPFFVWVKKGRVKKYFISHNADFCRLRISKYPANAQEMKYFFTLVIGWNGFGEIIIRWKRGKK